MAARDGVRAAHAAALARRRGRRGGWRALRQAGRCAVAALVPMLAPAPAAAEGEAPRVVARVNGAPITSEAVLLAENALRQQTGGAVPPEGIGREALRRAIFQELLYQEARAAGLRAEEADVRAAMERIRAGRGGRERAPEPELRAWVERNLLLERFLAREVAQKITVADADLRAAYEQRRSAFLVPERVAVTEVLFFLDPARPESLAAAEAVRARLLAAGGDASRLEPDGSFIVRELEIKREEEPQLHAAAIRLAPGELSGVLSAAGSLHLLRLNVFEPGRERSFEEVRPSLERALRARAERARLAELEAELRGRARIELSETKEPGP